MVKPLSCLWPLYAYRIRSKCCTAKLFLLSTQSRLSVKYNNHEFSQCIHRPHGSKHLLQTRFIVVNTAPPHERPHRTIIGVAQRAETRNMCLVSGSIMPSILNYLYNKACSILKSLRLWMISANCTKGFSVKPQIARTPQIWPIISIITAWTNCSPKSTRARRRFLIYYRPNRR